LRRAPFLYESEFYKAKNLPCLILPLKKNEDRRHDTSKPLPKILIYKNSSVSNYTLTSKNLALTDVVLNFKRLRFFPLARPHHFGDTMFTTSLGCVSKFLNKGKSFTKKKATFLLASTLLRRILMYSGINNMHLYVNNTPIYFQEILNNIHLPTKSIYSHPFLSNSLVDESIDNFKSFDFKYVSFTKAKSHGYIK
jgi:hypothetical protein